MNSLLRLLAFRRFTPLWLALSLPLPLLAADPVVSNLSASQRAGTKLVDITYDVAASYPLRVALEISSDGGSTFTVPATSTSGAIGSGVAAGSGKQITWNAGADWGGQASSTMRFKVTATDITPPPAPAGFVYVAGGTLPSSSGLSGQSVSTFYIAKTETTWGQWQSVRTYAAANGYNIGSAGAGNGDAYPVTNVTWYQMVKWCNARSEMEGLTPAYQVNGSVYKTGDSAPTVNATANGYRLPTEAQWEFAARGGANTQNYEYSGSNDINAVAWYSNNSSSTTHPVATKQANELGVSDMSGNVWEWCESWYPGSEGAFRVIRGGGWGSGADFCRVAYRLNFDPAGTGGSIGFRVASSSVP